MSDINYTISGDVSSGSLHQQFNASGVTADMTVSGVYAVTLSLGTSASQISTALVGSLGLCFVQNLATVSTHTVSFGRFDVGGNTLHESLSLRGGEAGVFRLAAGDYAAKAAVSGSRMALTIYEG